MAKRALKWPPFSVNTLKPNYAAWLKAVFESNGERKSLMDREELLEKWTAICKKQLPASRQGEAIAELSKVLLYYP